MTIGMQRVALLLTTLILLAQQSTATANSNNEEQIKEMIREYKERTIALEQYHEQILALTEETSNLDAKYVELGSRTDAVNSKIRTHNIQQLINLEDRLEETLEGIRGIKSAVDDWKEEQRGREPEPAVNDTNHQSSTENVISFQDLKEAFPSFEDYESGAAPSNPTAEAIWKTEIALEEYLIAEGTEIVREKVRAKVTEQKQKQAELMRQAKEERKKTVPCVSKAEAMDVVIDALTSYANDGIGRTDYALREAGSTIVYDPAFTSSTYTPPDSTVPSYMWHVLGGLPQLLFGKAPVASPEEIISKGVKMGSYWAFQGNKGKITIRLGQPIHVSAVSMDFISPKVDYDSLSSAPRYFDVIGYAPCPEGDAACDAWGFQQDGDGLFLGSFEFLTGQSDNVKSVQTFEIMSDTADRSSTSTSSSVEEEEEDDEEDEEDDIDIGSCGMEASESSCGGGGEMDSMQSFATYSDEGDDSSKDGETSTLQPIGPAIAAIKLEVTGNWGNADLTSIYRFRVHGIPVN